MDYGIRFRRYNRNTCESRISGLVFYSTNDGFGAASEHANTLLCGMRAVDPDVEYDILEIVGRGVQGATCGSGDRLWETTDEYETRLAIPGPLTA